MSCEECTNESCENHINEAYIKEAMQDKASVGKKGGCPNPKYYKISRYILDMFKEGLDARMQQTDLSEDYDR